MFVNDWIIGVLEYWSIGIPCLIGEKNPIIYFSGFVVLHSSTP